MKLILYEIRKVIFQKVFLVVGVLSIILNVFVFFNENNTEKIIFTEEPRSTQSQLQYIKSYPDFINEMENRAESQSKMFGDKDSFSYKNLYKTAQDYSHLKGIKLTPAKADSLLAVGGFSITDCFIIALIFLVGVYIFSVDNGLNRLIKTTSRGRKTTALTKLTAYGILTFAISIVFVLLNIFVSSAVYGVDDFGAKVQSIPQFRNCTLGLNIGEYYAVFMLSKAVAYLSFTFLFALIFDCFTSPIFRYSLCVGITATEYLLHSLIPDNSVINHIKYINIFSFTDTQSLLSQYLNLNIFNIPVNRLTVTAATILVMGVITTAVVTINLSRNRVIKERFETKHFKIKGSTSLFRGEIFKYLVHNKMAFLFFVLIAVSVLYSFGGESYPYSSGADVIYKNHMEYLHGEITPEKEKYIASKKEYIEKLEEKLNKDISSSMYDVISNTLENEKTALDKVEKQYERIKTIEKGKFIDENIYTRFVSDSSREWMQFALLSLLIIIAIPPIYTTEYKNKVIFLLRSSRKGKMNLYLSKSALGFIALLIMFTAVYLPYLIRFTNAFGTDGFSTKISCIEGFENAEISVILAFITQIICYFILATFVLHTVIFISVFSENNLLAMIISSVLLLIPILINLNNSIRFRVMFRVNWLMIFILSILICALLSTTLFIFAGCRFTNYRKGKK